MSPSPISAPAVQAAQIRADGVLAAAGLRVPFFSDGFSRAYGLPETRLVNLITEATPVREERRYAPPAGLREVHYSRPGLAAGLNLGTGPIRGLFAAAGVFGGELFQVSGGTLFKGPLAFGTVSGSDRVRFAASPGQVVCVAGGAVLVYGGGPGPFSQLTGGLLPPVSDVAFLRGRFVYACQGSDRFFYSEIGDASDLGGLNFATAESAADPIVALAVLNDELAVFGASSAEFWTVTADPNAPFQPALGRGYQRGCAARDSVAFGDNALFWVGDNRVVYRAGSVPQRISSPSIEDRLRQCADIANVSAWTATFEGHELYVLNIPGVGTYAYDISRAGNAAGAYGDSYSRGEWSEWRSFGRTTFRGQVAVTVNDQTYVGDDRTNDVWVLRNGVFQDGGDPLVRVASAFINVEEGTPRCNNLVLHGLVGQGGPSGPGAAPLVELRWSDDQGRTFTPWRAASLGRRGAYYTRVFWQRLDCLRAPGRLVEVRCGDPVSLVLSHLEMNVMRPAT